MIAENIGQRLVAQITHSPQRLVVSEAEAASMLNMAPRTLQGKRLDGSGPPFVRLSDRRIGYAVADLEKWIAARSFRSTSDATVRGLGAVR